MRRTSAASASNPVQPSTTLRKIPPSSTQDLLTHPDLPFTPTAEKKHILFGEAALSVLGLAGKLETHLRSRPRNRKSARSCSSQVSSRSTNKGGTSSREAQS
ncbi:unnamed protein product [Vitrella brassicaformis CCMP3155]|uniref:Uncharacterized protein n=1 Tax=Vitrella brassicaformis (strain CCMP3155) TaxID=1169540 RepID=A0A0G4EK87_VITBC|nr:unnamed protein product [Vitrella brassicaformis CCMP3155]|mmetsp:Transcript_25690/g.63715  ORF Transcript_25690/g.63715 Transcript_25690/m.63715 type:complete len:102 (-) Transcript_25690:536-841(-)|eukprot:CEL97860.1 unnamed protein product [Vitrella brassicaformis CCMP3155]